MRHRLGGMCAILAYVLPPSDASLLPGPAGRSPRPAPRAGAAVPLALGLLTVLLVLTGCYPQPLRGQPAQPLATEVSTDADLVARVPAEVAKDGVLDVGTDPAFQPMAYLTADNLLAGFDIALTQAIAAKLGLDPVFTLEAGTALESGVRLGRFEAAVAALPLGPRETSEADAVLYLDSGTRLATTTGSGLAADRLCGAAITALEGSVQVSQLSEASERCEAAGQPPVRILTRENQDAATRSVLVGSADGMVGEAPVVEAAVKTYAGELALASGVFAPVKLAILTDPAIAGLGQVVADAVDALIEDGAYAEILGGNGLTSGGVEQAQLLPAGSSY